jgi:cell division septation protein DedD
VFVFLIGYWLGKTTMKDVRTTNDQYLSEVEQTLGESRVNTAFASGQNTQSGTVLGEMPETTQAPEPVATISEPVIAPPVVVTTTTTVARATTTTTRPPATTTTTVRRPTASEATGNYTIQVSAHTSIEKARLVEDQLRSAGYNSYIVESMVNGTQYYRVRVGSFTTKSSAEDALVKLKATADGRDAYLISLD